MTGRRTRAALRALRRVTRPETDPTTRPVIDMRALARTGAPAVAAGVDIALYELEMRP